MLFVGCNKDDDLVDSGLRPYLEAFEFEANQRNLDISFDKTPIEARLELHENDLRLGWCSIRPGRVDKITINTLFWEIFDELGQEKLVFHELGHCILNRSHFDELKGNGRCKSIMQSGQRCGDDYSEMTRESYLDELFLRK